MRALSLRVLNALFDLANRIEVLVELRAVASPEGLGEKVHFLRDRIEDAAGVLHARQPLLRTAAVAEQPFEDDSRMRFRWIRRGFIPPGNGIHVEAVAGIARTLGRKIDREFE